MIVASMTHATRRWPRPPRASAGPPRRGLGALALAALLAATSPAGAAPEATQRGPRTRVFFVVEDGVALRDVDAATVLPAAVRLAVELLGPEDEIALVEVGEAPRLTMPPTAADTEAREALVGHVRAAGALPTPRVVRLGDALRLVAKTILGRRRDDAVTRHRVFVVGHVAEVGVDAAGTALERERTMSLVSAQLRSLDVMTSALSVGAGADRRLFDALTEGARGEHRFVADVRGAPHALLDLAAAALDVDTVPVDGRGQFRVDTGLVAARVWTFPSRSGAAPPTLHSPLSRPFATPGPPPGASVLAGPDALDALGRGAAAWRLDAPSAGPWRVEGGLDGPAPVVVIVDDSVLELDVRLEPTPLTIDDTARLRVAARYRAEGARRSTAARVVEGYVSVRDPRGRRSELPLTPRRRGVVEANIPTPRIGTWTMSVFVRADGAERVRRLVATVEPSCVHVDARLAEHPPSLSFGTSTHCPGARVAATLVDAHGRRTAFPPPRRPTLPLVLTLPHEEDDARPYTADLMVRRGAETVRLTRGPFPGEDGAAHAPHGGHTSPAHGAGHGAAHGAGPAPSDHATAQGHEAPEHAEHSGGEAPHAAPAHGEPHAPAHDPANEGAHDEHDAHDDVPADDTHAPSPSAEPRHAPEPDDDTALAAREAATATLTAQCPPTTTATLALAGLEPNWPLGLALRLAWLNGPLAGGAVVLLVVRRRRRGAARP